MRGRKSYPMIMGVLLCLCMLPVLYGCSSRPSRVPHTLADDLPTDKAVSESDDLAVPGFPIYAELPAACADVMVLSGTNDGRRIFLFIQIEKAADDPDRMDYVDLFTRQPVAFRIGQGDIRPTELLSSDFEVENDAIPLELYLPNEYDSYDFHLGDMKKVSDFASLYNTVIPPDMQYSIEARSRIIDAEIYVESFLLYGQEKRIIVKHKTWTDPDGNARMCSKDIFTGVELYSTVPDGEQHVSVQGLEMMKPPAMVPFCTYFDSYAQGDIISQYDLYRLYLDKVPQEQQYIAANR